MNEISVEQLFDPKRNRILAFPDSLYIANYF